MLLRNAGGDITDASELRNFCVFFMILANFISVAYTRFGVVDHRDFVLKISVAIDMAILSLFVAFKWRIAAMKLRTIRDQNVHATKSHNDRLMLANMACLWTWHLLLSKRSFEIVWQPPQVWAPQSTCL